MEPSEKIIDKREESDYSGFLYNLLTSSLIKGFHMGEIYKLGWLIGIAKHDIWADSLYRMFQKELYKFESLYKFIQTTYTTF
jgi:hypothetical protein